MHNLQKVIGVPDDYLEKIFRGKTGDRGTRLTTMLPNIKKRYESLKDAYTIAKIGGVAESKWTKLEREDLLHCYESAARALSDLKSLITECQNEDTRDFCPYCGIGAPRQFDHYLPKEKFPEFSIHAYNLVPCCGTCNGKKSDIWLDSKRARLFLNLYIDSLPTSPMLETDVQWVVRKSKRVPIVSFDLVQPIGFGVAEFGLIKSHFEKLELLSRYKDQAHTEFLVLRDAAVAREAETVLVLGEFLKKFLRQREITLGPLNWRIALYKAIVMDNKFLSECLKP